MTPQVESKYDVQAREFLAKFSLVLEIRRAEFQTCPEWNKQDCEKGKHGHGIKYVVMIVRALPVRSWPASQLPELTPPSLEFPFWNSKAEAQKPLPHKPSAYDVLAHLSSDANSPTTPDAVYAEFGDMKPSEATIIATHALKVHSFFTALEVEALSEIQ